MGAREHPKNGLFPGDFLRYVLSWHVMALSNAERQRRWREKHPEKRDERFNAFKAKKARDKAERAAATDCEHEDRGVRIEATFFYCGRCRRAIPMSLNRELKDADRNGCHSLRSPDSCGRLENDADPLRVSRSPPYQWRPSPRRGVVAAILSHAHLVPPADGPGATVGHNQPAAASIVKSPGSQPFELHCLRPASTA